MFTRKYRQMNADLQQQLAAERLHMAALDRSMARVEFDPDGNITDANENFLTLLGYRRDEILGKPHRQLCDGAYAQSEDYRRFWERLRRGEHFSGRCKRITREGRPLWLEATYNPVRDGQGRLLKVVKYASDIDAIVHQEHEMQSKLDALSRSMAMIEFDLDGLIVAVDDTPVGVFVELEGDDGAVRAAAARLGRPPADYLRASYRTIFLEHRARHGGAGEHMVFRDA